MLLSTKKKKYILKLKSSSPDCQLSNADFLLAYQSFYC